MTGATQPSPRSRGEAASRSGWPRIRPSSSSSPSRSPRTLSRGAQTPESGWRARSGAGSTRCLGGVPLPSSLPCARCRCGAPTFPPGAPQFVGPCDASRPGQRGQAVLAGALAGAGVLLGCECVSSRRPDALRAGGAVLRERDAGLGLRLSRRVEPGPLCRVRVASGARDPTH